MGLAAPGFRRRSTAGRLLLSGWQVAGIITAMSGQRCDIVDSASGSFYFGTNSGLSRPSWAPGATRATAASKVPPGYFFNPFVFVRPVVQTGQLIGSSNGAAVAGATGTDIRNVGRNVLRGPLQTNVDFSIIKRFRFSESKNIEFGAEFFNLFNQVNLANPVSNFNAAIINSNTGQFDEIDVERINIVEKSNCEEQRVNTTKCTNRGEPYFVDFVVQNRSIPRLKKTQRKVFVDFRGFAVVFSSRRELNTVIWG